MRVGRDERDDEGALSLEKREVGLYRWDWTPRDRQDVARKTKKVQAFCSLARKSNRGTGEILDFRIAPRGGTTGDPGWIGRGRDVGQSS